MLKMSLLLALALPSVASAQDLAPNTEVPMVLDREVSSQHARVGDAVELSVSQDVWAGSRLAIPRGTPGRGVVTWKTGKGAFGKSGKMEIELRSLQLAGRAVPINGRFRQEGRGNTAATVGTVLAAGVLAGALVTGHSAVFAQGTELRGYTASPFAAEIPRLPAPMFAAVAPAPSAAVASAVIAPVAVVSAMPAPAFVAPPIRYAATSAAAMAPAPTGHDPDRYAALLASQRGVRGRDARQGWTISD